MKKVIFFVLIGFVFSSCFVFSNNISDLFNSFPSANRQIGDTAPKARIMLINQNSKAWYARWAVLESAKETIDITYFIISNDPFGKSFLGLLESKAMKGVKIRLLVDARGTKDFVSKFNGGIDYMQELMQYPNVQVCTYNPTASSVTSLFSKGIKALISCTHDKIIIVDGKWVITGGRNIGHHYFADPRDDKTVFRDTDVIMLSRKVAKIAKVAFEEEFNLNKSHHIGKDLLGNWNSKKDALITFKYAMQHFMVKGNLLNEAPDLEALKEINEELSKTNSIKQFVPFASKFYEFFNTSSNKNIYPVKILDKHSMFGKRNDITPNLIKMIDASEDEIIIQNPYIVISKPVWEALRRASERNVKIIIYTNSATSNNHLIVQAAFHDDWKRMMKEMPTLRIFVRTDKRNLHSKVFTFDKTLSIIGTYNMDFLSQDMNSEVITLINSPVFTKQCRDSIMKEIRKSTIEYKIKINPDGTVSEITGPKRTLSDDLKKKLHKTDFFVKILRNLL